MEAATLANDSELPLFPQEEWYEQLLRYGLYLGAAFQLICILAVIFDVNPSKNDLGEIDSSSDEESEADEDLEVDVTSQRNRRRLERKKRR